MEYHIIHMAAAAGLLVNIRLFMYNILSVQTYNIRNIFLTAGQQNS